MTVRLLGLDFDDLDPYEAAAKIASFDRSAPFSYAVTPNSDHFVRLSRTPSLLPLYEGAAMRLLDSRVVATMARRLRIPAPKVCPGSDLTRVLFERFIPPDERVTIIGLRPEWLSDLVRKYGLRALPAHYNPPMGFEHDTDEMNKICQFVMDHPSRFVFLAVGSPRQESLATMLSQKGATGFGLCIGSSLEFLSGHLNRAPDWMQRGNLEWLHRMLSNPKLAKRYLIDCPAILPLLLKSRPSAKQHDSG